jgi:hypothetical protein
LPSAVVSAAMSEVVTSAICALVSVPTLTLSARARKLAVERLRIWPADRTAAWAEVMPPACAVVKPLVAGVARAPIWAVDRTVGCAVELVGAQRLGLRGGHA